MKNSPNLNKFTYAILSLVLILAAGAAAFAQSDRTYVSASGIDSASCGTYAAPCRTFNVALPKTNAGGEVLALESGVYDNFNVGVSISVTLAAANGIHAELPGIVVNTTTDDTVVLRNLYVSRRLEGITEGIKVTRVGALHIENCVVHGFTTGIYFGLNDPAQVFIQDTTVRKSIADGVMFFTNNGLLKASIDNSHFDENGTGGVYNGIDVLKKTRLTVKGSTANGNGGAGFAVGNGDLNLDHCAAANNRDGVVASGDPSSFGSAIVSNSVMTNNSRYGFYQLDSGALYTLGNNVVRRNTTNTFGTLTVLSGT